VVPDGSLRPDGRIVTSPDGVQVSSTPLAPLIGDGPWVPAGITVNADATVLRLTRPDTDGITGGRPDPAQRLLVGTPS
jgi:hypothetical protein